MSRGKTEQARVSYRYGPHLDAIARIYVEEGGVATRAARRVQKELGFKSFSNMRFKRWERKAEWIAALDTARGVVQIRRRAAENVGGERFLTWAQETGDALRERYEMLRERARTEAIDCDSDLTKLEGRVLKLREAARGEERHLTEQRLKEAMAANAQFAKMLLAQLAEFELPEAAMRRLREIAENPTKFLQELL